MGSKSDDNDIRQRIDRWMWCARFFKTRSIAARFVGTGKVRVNGTRVTKAAHQVRPGDVLTFPLGDRIRIIEVVTFVEKRGSATIAATLYDDQSPLAPPKGKDKPVNPSPEAAPDSRARAKLRELKAQ